MSYATAAEIKAYSALSEIAALSDDDLNNKYIPRAERIINSYCRQNFNRSALKVITVDGSGGNRLELPERLISLSSLRFIDGGAHTAQANGLANLDFVTANHYSISDDTKVEISGGQANLIGAAIESITYPFTTPGNYTHGADIVVSGGVASLVNTPFPSDGVIFAPFTNGKDAAWSTGSITGTLHGGASVAAGKLDAEGNDDRGVIYSDAVIGAVGQVFTMRCLYTPDYTGLPPTNTNIMSLGQPGGGAANKFVVFNSPSGGNIRITAHNNAGGIEMSAQTVASWSPTAGQEYEIEVNVDLAGGTIRVFVDGVQLGADISESWARGTNATEFRLGADVSTYQISNGKFDNGILFDAVQHTSGYTPGSFPVETNYVLTDPVLETNDTLTFTRFLDIFTMVATISGSDGIGVILSSDNGVTYKYWNGAAWVASDESFAQSNTAAVAHTNLPTLASSGTFKMKLIFHSADGSTTPSVDSVFVSDSNSYPTDDNLYVETTDLGQISPDCFLSWASIAFTTVIPAGDDIRVLLSLDGRDTWVGWDGSAWSPVAAPTVRTNATSLSDAIANFPQLDALSTLDVRIFLYTSTVLETPEIRNVQIESLTLSKNAVVSSVNIDQFFNKNWYLMADSEPVRARSRIGKQERLEDTLIFPLGFNNIEITGYFGYASVPLAVRDAVAEVIEKIVVQEGSAVVKHGTFKKEKIGDYSYELGGTGNTSSEGGRDTGLSGTAKDFLRDFRKPILMGRI